MTERDNARPEPAHRKPVDELALFKKWKAAVAAAGGRPVRTWKQYLADETAENTYDFALWGRGTPH